LQATEVASELPADPTQPDVTVSAAASDQAAEPSAESPAHEGNPQEEVSRAAAPQENLHREDNPREPAAQEEQPKRALVEDEPPVVRAGPATEREPPVAEPPAPEPIRVRSDPSPERPHASASDRRPDSEPAPAVPWPLIGTGVLGVLGGLVAFLLLLLLGAWPRNEVVRSDDAASALAPRIAAVEDQVRELAARPAPQGVDPQALADLATRLNQLERTVAAPRAPVSDPAVSGRLTATENAMKSLADNVAALSRRNDELAATLRETGSRLDSLAATVAELQKVAHASAAGADRAVRLAVAASSLQGAVERGDPFAAELAVAEQFAADPNILAPLKPFAAAGVPSAAALASELSKLIQPMRSAEQAAAPRGGDGFLDRLQANAERLVRIRPIDEPPPEKSGAALARIEALAARSDLNDMVAELNKLPEPARAPARPWVAKVEARNKALETARRFTANAVAALKPSPDR
jgi:hypothetical protein